MCNSSIVFFFFSSRRRHTRCALVTGVQTCALPIFNFAVQRAKGIDFESSYRVPVASGNLTLRAMATRYIKNYFDNGIEVPTDTVGQNAPGGTPKWLYRVQGTYSNDDFTFNLTGRGVRRGGYDNSFTYCTASCPLSTVTNRTINDNRIAGAFYLEDRKSTRLNSSH